MKIWLFSLLPRNLAEVIPLAGSRRDNNSRNSSQTGNTNNQEAMIHYSLRAAMHLDVTNPKEEKAALNGNGAGGVGHLTMPSNNNHSHHLPAISNSIIPSRGLRDQDDESYLEGSYQNGGPCILYPGGDYCKPSICDPSEHDFRTESLLSTSVQVCIAITLAGFGNVGAGLILDMVQHWTVFKTINELFILVPSLLGLKGNLEMTMAARLSTQANLGNMREFDTTMRMVKGNMALVQCQATVVAFLASLFALLSNAFTKGVFDLHNSLIICASSLITANVACFLLGACMVGVIILSHRYEIDPDNIATPLAASIGDVTTLALLASFAQLLQNHDPHGVFPYLSCCIIIVVMAALPLWFMYAYRNEYTASIVTTGWIPIILAMLISSMGGFILDHATNRFIRLAMFQPVVNGVGGNLVAVQASRLSTYLHKRSKLGHFPEGIQCLISPCRAFIGSTINVRTARVLLMMSFPAHFLYLGVFRIIKGSEGFDMTFLFLFTYIIFAVFQVMLLLYFAHNLVMLLWRNSADPDNYSIPILTALGDFLGTAFLFAAFIILSQAGDINALST